MVRGGGVVRGGSSGEGRKECLGEGSDEGEL